MSVATSSGRGGGLSVAALRRSVRRDAFSDFLPLVSWDGDSEAFLCIDDAWGHAWEIEPTAYMFSHVQAALQGLFNVHFPDGTVLQLHTFADPLSIADAFLCLFAVGILLGAVRQATGSIAACIGLHAGWVWVLQVVRETTMADRAHPASFLLSAFDGLVGWMMLAWTVVIGLALQRFYVRRGA